MLTELFLATNLLGAPVLPAHPTDTSVSILQQTEPNTALTTQAETQASPEIEEQIQIMNQIIETYANADSEFFDELRNKQVTAFDDHFFYELDEDSIEFAYFPEAGGNSRLYYYEEGHFETAPDGTNLFRGISLFTLNVGRDGTLEDNTPAMPESFTSEQMAQIHESYLNTPIILNETPWQEGISEETGLSTVFKEISTDTYYIYTQAQSDGNVLVFLSFAGPDTNQAPSTE